MRNTKTHCLQLHVMCGDGQGSCELCVPYPRRPPVLPAGVREAVARLSDAIGPGDPADDVEMAADIRTVLAALSGAGE